MQAELQVWLTSSSHLSYSGADLAALVREASVNSLRECMKISTDNSAMVWETPVTENCNADEQSGHVGVGMRHFDLALQKIKPSVSQKARITRENVT